MLLEQDLDTPWPRGSRASPATARWRQCRRRCRSARCPSTPTRRARALVLLVGMTLLLGGLTRLLNVTGARRLVGWIVAFGTALALFGIIQYAMLGDHAYGGMRIYGFWQPMNLLTTPFGPFVNKNHFAGWMLMGLPLAMGLGARAGPSARQRIGASRLARRPALALLARRRQAAAGGAGDRVHGRLAPHDAVRVRGSLASSSSMLVAGAVVGKRFGAGPRPLARRWARWCCCLLAPSRCGGAPTSPTVSLSGSVGLRRVIWRDSAAVIARFPPRRHRAQLLRHGDAELPDDAAQHAFSGSAQRLSAGPGRRRPAARRAGGAGPGDARARYPRAVRAAPG